MTRVHVLGNCIPSSLCSQRLEPGSHSSVINSTHPISAGRSYSPDHWFRIFIFILFPRILFNQQHQITIVTVANTSLQKDKLTRPPYPTRRPCRAPLVQGGGINSRNSLSTQSFSSTAGLHLHWLNSVNFLLFYRQIGNSLSFSLSSFCGWLSGSFAHTKCTYTPHTLFPRRSLRTASSVFSEILFWCLVPPSHLHSLTLLLPLFHSPFTFPSEFIPMSLRVYRVA